MFPMKIYTKTGDRGETSLYKGGRVPKDEPRLAAYGTLDELNSVLGLALAHLGAGGGLETVRQEVARVQKDLFSLGAQLATRGEEKPAWHIKPEDIDALETAIDGMETELEPLKTFILPGGHPVGAAFHLARTVARRAEREVVGLQRDEAIDPQIVQYLNRLSDYLFVLARFTNHRLGTPETTLQM
jgi:cob(I)alamin adenosyltransferase